MNSDYSKFRATIDEYGLQQGNRFSVQISKLSESENRMCMAVNMGVMAPETFNWQNVGPKYKFIHNIEFGILTLSFYNLENNEPYAKLFAWNRLAMTDDFHINDFDTYATGNNIIVTEHNRQGQDIAQYEYVDCYPSGLTGKTLSYQNGQAALTFDCAFTYVHMSLKRPNTVAALSQGFI